MNVLMPLVGVGVAICAAGGSFAISKLHRGPLPRLQLAVFIFVGFAVIGGGVADAVFTYRADVGGAEVQKLLDATAAHEADLKRRIDAHSIVLRASLAEPQTSSEPPSIERVQAWQKKMAVLGDETAALSAENSRLGEEIAATQLVIVAAEEKRDVQRRSSNAVIFASLAYISIGWSTIYSANRRRRAEALRQFDPTLKAVSARVKQLSLSGDKIATIVAYREETGVTLVEAKKTVEALSDT
jgi:ribosomal protein L7/L12